MKWYDYSRNSNVHKKLYKLYRILVKKNLIYLEWTKPYLVWSWIEEHITMVTTPLSNLNLIIICKRYGLLKVEGKCLYIYIHTRLLGSGFLCLFLFPFSLFFFPDSGERGFAFSTEFACVCVCVGQITRKRMTREYGRERGFRGKTVLGQQVRYG